MNKHFNFIVLIVLAVQAFVLSVMFSSSAPKSPTNLFAVPVALAFLSIGSVAAFTAIAIRSINRRLDAAGVPEDTGHALSKSHSKIQEIRAGADENKSSGD